MVDMRSAESRTCSTSEVLTVLLYKLGNMSGKSSPCVEYLEEMRLDVITVNKYCVINC